MRFSEFPLPLDSRDSIPRRLAAAFDSGFWRTYDGEQGRPPRRYVQADSQAAFEAGWKLGRTVHEARGEKVLQERRRAALITADHA